MAKQSSKDALLARIDGDITKAEDMHDFIAGNTGDQALIGKVEAKIAELHRMRDYVTVADGNALVEAKPKRTRKRKGLPADAPTA